MASEPEAQAKLDGGLAWAIRGWASNPTTVHTLNMNDAEIESLARHLTAAGFEHRGEVASVDYIESIGAVLNPAFKGAYDAIMKGRTQK